MPDWGADSFGNQENSNQNTAVIFFEEEKTVVKNFKNEGVDFTKYELWHVEFMLHKHVLATMEVWLLVIAVDSENAVGLICFSEYIVPLVQPDRA